MAWWEAGRKGGEKTALETLDFHVEIGTGSGDDRDPGRPRSYEVTLRGSDGDEASEVRPFPLTPGELRALDTTVPHAVLSSAARLRRTATDDERPVRELGRRLFDFLLGGKGRPLLTAARHRAVREDRPLRIVLRVRPTELARLPWEFLFDEDGYLCQTTPLVRRPEVGMPERPLPVEPPLRVLCMAALPDDREPLAVRAEQEWLDRALSGLRRQGLIDVTWTEGPTWRDLSAALRDRHWHAFHFIGHGGFDAAGQEGTLALADDDGGTYHLGADGLVMLLSRQTSLRLVVLNACETGRSADHDPFSSVAGALMRRGLPAAVAMQYPISNDAAVEFSRTFYESLAHRRPVDEAVTEARQTIRLARRGTLEWGTPVLFMRSLDGRLFDLATTGAPVPAAAEVEDLYVEGLAALRRERWQRAVEIFREVTVRDPGHPYARAKYDEALRLRRLHALYEAGLAAAEQQRWSEAVEHLEAVATADPGFRDAPARLAEVRRRAAAAALRAEARALHAAGEWEAVVATGDELAALLPENPDPDGLVTEARNRLATGPSMPEEPPPVEHAAAVEGPPLVEHSVGVEGVPPVGSSVAVEEALREASSVAADEASREGSSVAGDRAPREDPSVAADGAPSVFPVGRGSGLASGSPVVERAAVTRVISEWTPPVVPDRVAPAGPFVPKASSNSSTARGSESPDRDAPIRLPGRPLNFAFSPDGARFVIGCAGRKAVVSDVTDAGAWRVIRHGTTLERLGKLVRDDETPLVTALAPGGRQLVTYAKPTVRTWDVDTRSPLGQWPMDAPGSCVALGREGLSALVFTKAPSAHHWRVSRGQPHDLVGQETEVALAVASRDGTMFATVDAPIDLGLRWVRAAEGIRIPARELRVRVWDAATGRMLADRSCGTDVIRVALHPHNTAFVTGHSDGTVRLWGPEGEGAEVARVGAVFFLDVAYDSDGTRLAVATEEWVTVRETGTDEVVCSRRYRNGWKARAVAFGPDGRARALVSRDHEVWLTTVDRVAEGNRIEDLTQPDRPGAAP
ncbi:CHAT domain-containing protein [Streptomyces sp. NPDC047081]|uniref:CHAT domain-containing protein n=1 Tax=Streptomyces sp. NPDC047081 TaxID=3154706 RepID=UPI0033F01EFE